MLSNYPPGVTGSEDAFGPKDESDQVMKCDNCGISEMVTIERYNEHYQWECEHCEHIHSWQIVTEADWDWYEG